MRPTMSTVLPNNMESQTLENLSLNWQDNEKKENRTMMNELFLSKEESQ